ncbi:MAG TPA: aminopeptidase P N-terminal domain-containing protein [Gemmatimonadales bacterium]|jgi:Xaa-Pro aminopeptidase
MRTRLVFALVFASAPLHGQLAVPPAPEPVEQLPGFGRPVPIEEVRARRQALLEQIGPGVVLLPAARRARIDELVIQDNDFRQDDYFFYLTGLETEDAWLLLSVAGGERGETLFLPARVPQRETWTGRRLGPGQDAVALSGIGEVRELQQDSLRSAVLAALHRTGGPLYLVMRGAIDGRGELEQWRAGWPDVRDATSIINGMRAVKDAAEIAALRRAITITAQAHRAAMREMRPGMREYEVEAVIEYTFRRHGADRVAFPSIVGSGPNSTTLHYDVNRRTMAAGDLVVIDIGAEYGQYAADVTRTVPVSGTYTPRQRAVYELVLATQQTAIDSVRPGLTLRELGAIATRFMREHSTGVCPGDDCTPYFNHGLSHWLGMRVHDVGGRVPLAPGMVFTIEPGIYLPDEQLGVRIEDDILVTTTGAEVLSRGAPRAVDDIEALMRSERGERGNGGW